MSGDKTICQNKKARHDYFIEDTPPIPLSLRERARVRVVLTLNSIQQ